jgi:hypothetical protein
MNKDPYSLLVLADHNFFTQKTKFLFHHGLGLGHLVWRSFFLVLKMRTFWGLSWKVTEHVVTYIESLVCYPNILSVGFRRFSPFRGPRFAEIFVSFLSLLPGLLDLSVSVAREYRLVDNRSTATPSPVT